LTAIRLYNTIIYYYNYSGALICRCIGTIGCTYIQYIAARLYSEHTPLVEPRPARSCKITSAPTTLCIHIHVVNVHIYVYIICARWASGLRSISSVTPRDSSVFLAGRPTTLLLADNLKIHRANAITPKFDYTNKITKGTSEENKKTARNRRRSSVGTSYWYNISTKFAAKKIKAPPPSSVAQYNNNIYSYYVITYMDGNIAVTVIVGTYIILFIMVVSIVA